MAERPPKRLFMELISKSQKAHIILSKKHCDESGEHAITKRCDLSLVASIGAFCFWVGIALKLKSRQPSQGGEGGLEWPARPALRTAP